MLGSTHMTADFCSSEIAFPCSAHDFTLRKDIVEIVITRCPARNAGWQSADVKNAEPDL